MRPGESARAVEVSLSKPGTIDVDAATAQPQYARRRDQRTTNNEQRTTNNEQRTLALDHDFLHRVKTTTVKNSVDALSIFAIVRAVAQRDEETQLEIRYTVLNECLDHPLHLFLRHKHLAHLTHNSAVVVVEGVRKEGRKERKNAWVRERE